MEAMEFWKYFNCIESIKASEILDSFTATSYPHLKQNKRSEVFGKIKRQIGKIVERPRGNLASYEDVISKLRGFGSGG